MLRVFSLVLLSLSASLAEAQEIGQPHPGFRLPTLDGSRTISLASLRGKKVLLIEFASW